MSESTQVFDMSDFLTKQQEHPLSKYCNDLFAKKPFHSWLYGDGEFLVASRRVTGRRMQNKESISPELENELRQSLLIEDPRIIRGTDMHLINYNSYEGADKDSLIEIGKRTEEMLTSLLGERKITWVDGVVWDTCAQQGLLGAFLTVLRQRNVIFVGNQSLTNALINLRALTPQATVLIPDYNACTERNRVALRILDLLKGKVDPVVLLCVGLSAIPIAMQILTQSPETTCLDLGSVLDVFAGIGIERGWRRYLYADPIAHWMLIKKNLEEVQFYDSWKHGVVGKKVEEKEEVG